MVNDLKSAAGAGSKTRALDPDRLRILAVGESTFTIGDLHACESFRPVVGGAEFAHFTYYFKKMKKNDENTMING